MDVGFLDISSKHMMDYNETSVVNSRMPKPELKPLQLTVMVVVKQQLPKHLKALMLDNLPLQEGKLDQLAHQENLLGNAVDVNLDPPGLLVNRVLMVYPEKTADQEKMDLLDKMHHQQPELHRVFESVPRDLLDHLARPVTKDPEVILVNKVNLVRQEIPALVAHLANKDPKDHLVYPADLEIKVNLANTFLALHHPDHLEDKEKWVRLELQDQLDSKAKLASKDPKAHKVIKAIPDLMVNLDQQDPLDPMDHPVLLEVATIVLHQELHPDIKNPPSSIISLSLVIAVQVLHATSCEIVSIHARCLHFLIF